MNVTTFNGRRLDWRALVALVLVPLLVAGTFLAATWRYDDNLHRVRAAVVNNDVMVKIKGQSVPLGRQLSAALVDSEKEQNFTWVLADEANAKAGLANGQYAAVVTIPRNFSAAATSYAGAADEAHQATITIQTSTVGGIAETALGQSVADAATQSLNSGLTEAYLDNIYIGFNTMGEQFVSVAQGARKLATGASELSDGVTQASDGTAQLASGMGKLSDGGGQLRDGASQLAGGTAQFSTGLGAYTDGVGQYVDGINTLVNPMIDLVGQLPDLTALVKQIDALMVDFPATAATLDDQVRAAAKLITSYLDDTGQLTGALTQLLAALQGAQGDIDAIASGDTTVPCPANLKDVEGGCEAFADGVKAGGAAASDSLSQLDADKVQQALAAIKDATPRIKAALAQLTKATGWLATNAEDIQSTWTSIKKQIPAGTTPNQYLLDQLTALRDGGNQLKAGGAQLDAGAQQLASGVAQLSTGVGQYTDGVTQAASGADELADGMKQLDSGTAKLAGGADKLASGLESGADKLPSYSASDRDKLSTVVTSPVSTAGMDGLVTPAVGAVSLLLVIALWLGALATYALIRPVDPRNAASSASTGHLYARVLLPGAVVGLVQAAALTVLGASFLGLGVGQSFALLGVLALAGVAFAAVNHALAAWAGVWGRLVSLAMLLVTAAAALTYTAPEAFAALRPLSPASPALDAARGAIVGGPVALPVVVLGFWLVAGLLAGAHRIVQSRTVSVKALALAS